MNLLVLSLSLALIGGYECVCVADDDEVWCVCETPAPDDEIHDEDDE